MRLLQHSAYRGPRDRLRAALDNHRPGHMVFVIGPSGVGKTTMRRSVMREMFGNPNLWEKEKFLPSRRSRACQLEHTLVRDISPASYCKSLMRRP